MFSSRSYRIRSAVLLLLLLLLLPLLLSCFDDDTGPVSPPPGFALVPAGSFRMGEADPFDGVTGTRYVRLTRSFTMAARELTLGEYLRALNRSLKRDPDIYHFSIDLLSDLYTGATLLYFGEGSGFTRDAMVDTFRLTPGFSADLPVTWVTWFGAASYCDWLNWEAGLPASYDHSGSGWVCGPGGDPYRAEGWRLPTEAEWEYAARYPDSRRWPWGEHLPDCGMVNGIAVEGEPRCTDWPQPVGSYSPMGNSWLNLRDMSGNVAEWCQDWFGYWDYYSDLVDPVDIEADELDKLLRGGSYRSPHYTLALWHRDHLDPGDASDDVGFRICRTWRY